MDIGSLRGLLLTVVLLLSKDAERSVFTAATPSWQCKSDYCVNKHKPSTHEVTFTDMPRPATLAIGCLGRQVDLICCTANYKHISWQFRLDDSTWTDFLSVDPDNRCLSEDNQTASIDNFLHKYEGLYRCMAHGHSGDVITNDVRLEAQDCSDFHGPPVRTTPSNESEIERAVGQSADVPCIGFFGNLAWCGPNSFDCAIGWTRHPFNVSDFVPITNDSSQRVYTETSPLGGDKLRSRLLIKNVADDDYRGSYECWMVRSAKWADTALVRVKPERRVEVPSVYRVPAIVCGSVVAFAVVLLVVLCPLRHNIKLAVKQRHRTPPSSEGLSYDVLLLHADSDAANEFGDFLRRKLTEFSKPAYSVFHYSGDDVYHGQNKFRAMEDSLKSSRCAIVVVCPTFVARYDESRFHLENLVTEVDVIYVVYDGLDVADLIEKAPLGATITASIRNGRCLTWSWPIKDDAQHGLKDKLDIAVFWRHLKLAIPNRRRTATSAGAGTIAPASAASGTAATTGRSSPESDWDAGGCRCLLPTTA